MKAATIIPCTVRIRKGCVVFRLGRAWSEGEYVSVTPADALHLIERGLAMRA
jgi:hypothetical protein